MKKFRILTAMLLVVAVLLSGCGLLVDLIFEQSMSYSNMQYTRPDMDDLNAVLESSCAAALQETDISELEDAIWAFYNVYDDFYTNMNLAFIEYCRDLSDLYWQGEYSYCSEQSATVDAGLDSLYRALAKSPIRDTLETDEYFGAGYFDSYEGESIYDENLLALLSREAQLQTRYQSINNDATAVQYYSEEYFSQYGTQMAQVFLELVQVRRQIADYLDYDSYVDFAYDFYYVRDYTPEQAIGLMADIRAELVPLYRQAMQSAYDDITLDYSSQTQTLHYVETMAKEMGGTVYQAFRDMKKRKLYDITYSENKYNTSFEVYLSSYFSPYVFLCPTGTEYDKLTFAHEFGHFCCDYASWGANQGVDVAEIFSQGMEYLSLFYADDTEQTEKLKMLDSICVYVEQAAYAAFEHQVYDLADDALTVEGIQRLYAQIMADYGMDIDGRDDRDYVCVTHFYESPLYVISYVLSNDAALQMYELERAQTGEGLDCYVRNMTSSQAYFLAFVEEAGLESPFAVGRMSQVKQTITQILG